MEPPKIPFSKSVYLNSFLEKMPKFRLVTRRKWPQGALNPIKYEEVQYNHGIEYHSGTVLIMQSGWYTFTANTRGYPMDNNIALHIALNIRVEDEAVAFALGTGYS